MTSVIPFHPFHMPLSLRRPADATPGARERPSNIQAHPAQRKTTQEIDHTGPFSALQFQEKRWGNRNVGDVATCNTECMSFVCLCVCVWCDQGRTKDGLAIYSTFFSNQKTRPCHSILRKGRPGFPLSPWSTLRSNGLAPGPPGSWLLGLHCSRPL